MDWIWHSLVRLVLFLSQRFNAESKTWWCAEMSCYGVGGCRGGGQVSLAHAVICESRPNSTVDMGWMVVQVEDIVHGDM